MNNISDPIRNKIQESSLIVLDLEKFKPEKEEIVEFDLAPLLEHGFVAKLEFFDQKIEEVDWNSFEGKHVAVHCSTDAILPPWPLLKIASVLNPIAESVEFSTKEARVFDLWKATIENLDYSQFSGERVILKANSKVPHAIYTLAGFKFREVVQTLMYGMPKNAIPVYKRKISS